MALVGGAIRKEVGLWLHNTRLLDSTGSPHLADYWYVQNVAEPRCGWGEECSMSSEEAQEARFDVTAAYQEAPYGATLAERTGFTRERLEALEHELLELNVLDLETLRHAATIDIVQIPGRVTVLSNGLLPSLWLGLAEDPMYEPEEMAKYISDAVEIPFCSTSSMVDIGSLAALAAYKAMAIMCTAWQVQNTRIEVAHHHKSIGIQGSVPWMRKP